MQELHEKINKVASLKDATAIIQQINTLNFLQIENIKEDAKKIYHYAVKELLKVNNNIETINLCISYLEKLLSIDPDDIEAQNMFKICNIYLTTLPEFANDIQFMENILSVKPYDHDVQYIIGSMYARCNNVGKALEHFKLALGMTVGNPEFRVKILHSIGELYYANNNTNLCCHYLLEACKINPKHPDANNLLGMIYNGMGFIDKAIEHFTTAIEFCEHSNNEMVLQQSAVIYMNLGTAWTHKINYRKAIEYFDKALQYNPKLIPAFQNKLFNTHYILHTIDDPMYLSNLHKQINNFYPHQNAKQEIKCKNNAKLKIGFISSEFVYNGICGVVSYFINGILQHINYDKFEIICYSLKPVIHVELLYPKAIWKFVRGISTEGFKSMIQSDDIDILFDLATHTGEDRLDVFVARAAPIQISYCGYPNTSGLTCMDYHITDKYCDSDGITPGPGGTIRPSTQKYYTEKLLFMDHCFLDYTPYITPLPNLCSEQPALSNGYLTLGCFNKFNKINENVIAVWEQILEACKNVCLIVKCKEFRTESMKSQFLQMWKNKELHKRITVMSHRDTNTDHLLEYNKIDIALDTFPYSGTSTTCDALMMGTPVMTLFDGVRQYHVQNVTSSIMINCQLPEFVCLSEDEYVSKIQHYAENLEKLQCMKERVRNNFLDGMCNHKRFVAEFETKMMQLKAN